MRCSRLALNLLLIASTVVATLLTMELGLRLVGMRYPAFYKVDARRGYGLRPHAEGVQIREGQGQVQINAAGFRGSLPDHNPKEDTFRIAVLGDSFTEALQVDEQKTWIRQLQYQLNSSKNCPVLRGGQAELLNFGVGGYSTGQALLTWRYQAKAFHPDLVILAIYPGNDFTDNEPGPRDDRPGFVLKADGSLFQDNSFQSSAGYRFRTSVAGRMFDGLINHSRLVQLLNEAKNRFSALRRRSQGLEAMPASGVPSPPPNASPEAWLLTDALIRQLNRDVRASGARLLVVSTSSPDQVWPDASVRSATPFHQERRLGRLLKAAGLAYRPLAPSLQRAVDQDQSLVLHGFQGGEPGHGHWNESGHDLAARQLAPWLCQQ